MYYGRKKGIIIALVVVLLVIVLAIVGFFVFTKTDLFKSNKTLFWKYAESMTDENSIFKSTQLEELQKLMEQKPYTIEGDFTLGSDNEDMDELLNLMRLDVKSEVDTANAYSHTGVVWEMGNEALLDLDYLQSDKVYALKSNDIVTIYLGIRNENLKVLAQKLGVTDTSMIPDELSFDEYDYSELFSISELELQHIKDTYGKIIVDSIPDSNYSKQTSAVLEKNGTSYTTTSYRLDLSGQELKEIEVRMLEELKTDSITLNLISTKLKLLGADEDQVDIEELAKYVDDIITEMADTAFEDVSFVVYNYKGNNIATEMIVKNQQKITIFKDANNITFKLEDLTGDDTYQTINVSIDYTLTSTQTSYIVKVSLDNEERLSINWSNNGSAAQGSLTTELTVNVALDDQNIEATYNQTLEFVDELTNMIKIDETNCAIINDYPQDQLIGLFQAIYERIEVVAVEKEQIISNVFANQSALERAQLNTDTNTTNTLEEDELDTTETTNSVTGNQNGVMQINQP